MTTITVTGRATRGAPAPDMGLSIIVDGQLAKSTVEKAVALNRDYTLSVDVTTEGSHEAYATMKLTNPVGSTSTLQSAVMPFTVRPLVRVHVNRMSYERRHLAATVRGLRVTQIPGAVLYNPTYGYAYDYNLEWNIEVQDAGIAPCQVAYYPVAGRTSGVLLSGGCGGSGTYRFTAYEGQQFRGEIGIYTVRIPLEGSEGKTFTAVEETDWWVNYDITVQVSQADGLRVAYNTALFNQVYGSGSHKGRWRIPDIMNYLDFFAQWYPYNMRMLVRFYPQDFPIVNSTYTMER